MTIMAQFLHTMRLFSAVIICFSVFILYTANKFISTAPETTFSTLPVVVGHAVSLIRCPQKRTKGFLDAFLILRHSIHQNSVHSGHGEYSYQMYAIIHEQCRQHAPTLKRMGYTPLVRPSLVNITEIQGEYYRTHVEQENCCGSAEFIKLYAYELTQHPIVVHWDLDVAILQPLDSIYNAMLYHQRNTLALQSPYKWPSRVNAMFTRDVTSAQPTEAIRAVQGGMVVLRPNPDVLKKMKQIILIGNYTGGRGPRSGWESKGYGGFQGAMAFQGLLAYYYDIVEPNTSAELDVCRYNQVAADVIWRGPNLMQHYGQCRQHPAPGISYEDNTPSEGKCEDCRSLPVEDTMTAHYTACKKPWECTIPYPRIPRSKKQVHRLQELTNITTCGLLVRRYFHIRSDLEERIRKATGTVVSKSDGKFEPDTFGGYCRGRGSYIAMNLPTDLDLKSVYGF